MNKVIKLTGVDGNAIYFGPNTLTIYKMVEVRRVNDKQTRLVLSNIGSFSYKEDRSCYSVLESPEEILEMMGAKSITSTENTYNEEASINDSIENEKPNGWGIVVRAVNIIKEKLSNIKQHEVR